MIGGRSRSCVLAVLAGGVVLASAGCSSGGVSSPVAISSGSAAPSSSAAVSSSASSPSAVSSGAPGVLDANGPEAQGALVAYRGMWADVVAAAATDDYQNPKLGQHLSGDAGSYWAQALYVDKTKGAVAHGEPKLLNPTVTRVIPSVSSPQVVVDDCVDEAPWRLFTTDGTRFDSDAGGRHKVEVLVVQAGGVWKVTKFAYSRVGTC